MRLLIPAALLTAVTLGACTAASPASTVPSAPAGGPAPASRPATYAIMKAELVRPGVLKLQFAAGYAPCYGKLGRVEVRQDPKRVTVTLHRTYPRPPNPDQMCPQYRKLEWTRVTLDSPLGTRALVDGSTGKSVPVHD